MRIECDRCGKVQMVNERIHANGAIGRCATFSPRCVTTVVADWRLRRNCCQASRREQPTGAEDRATGGIAEPLRRFLLVVIGLAVFVIFALVFDIWRLEIMAPPGFR